MTYRNCMLLILALAVCTSSNAWALNEEQLRTELNRTLDNDPTARRTTVALKVVDLQTDEVLYDRFGDRLFTPASNLKIYTSACALDLFGPQHTFPTKITARVDRQNHAIVSDVTLIGGGNAMLSSAELELLADRVINEWNIKTIHGQVKVDNSRYSDTQLGPGWMWDDQEYYYNMQVTPLMVDFNARKVPGKFDEDGDPIRIAVQAPAFWIGYEFDKMLRERGVEFADETTDELIKTVRRTLSAEGVPLAATLKHFNHVSENAVGEMLLHEIAIAHGKRQPTWSDGASEITKWLEQTAGLEHDSFRLVDGSGLSRYNLISADSSVKLLQFMRRHRHYATFYQSLPTYGVEVRPGEEQTLVRAKPGGMSSVSTISGYLQTLKGRQLAFSLLANGYIGSAKPVFELRQKVWQALAKYQPGKN